MRRLRGCVGQGAFLLNIQEDVGEGVYDVRGPHGMTGRWNGGRWRAGPPRLAEAPRGRLYFSFTAPGRVITLLRAGRAPAWNLAV